MKTIQKALDILELFLDRDDEIGLAEIASLTGLNVSTAHRIVATLMKRGYLNQRQKRQKYSLSTKLLQFSHVLSKRMKIRDLAFPILDGLNKMVSESVNIAILDQNEAVYIEHIESNQNLRMFTQVGNRVPLHSTGVGKVFLAHMNDEQLEDFLNGKPLPSYTKNTITDVDKLKHELIIISEEGVGIDDEEREIGVKCIASPIKNSNGGVVAAISVSGPSARLSNKRVQEIKPLIKSCALEISRAMGYQGE
ncbi:MAG TPA: IclR family transcriptional regulator [Dehalococcoidia bacterium]|nr:IclR family transcriptional regulator [Dehalococcoidia bacterium]